MRVLFLASGHDDFLADGLFHGLRTLLGAEAVDLPRMEHLYADHPVERRPRLHGLGFTLAGLLGDDGEVDRERAAYRAVAGEFDLVVFADVWRNFGAWTQWMPQLREAGVPMAVLDTSDRVEPYPYAGLWWRRRVWWTLPRVLRRATHFKREVTDWTGWFRSYLVVPGPVARRVAALTEALRPISFSIPEEWIVDRPPTKAKNWPAHIVDPEVAARVGGRTGYAFADADAYHADLRASRFGVTTKKAGWDALRHYEIAAAGAVPCFRDLHRKPPRCAPFGLDATNAIAYRDPDDLLRRVQALDAGEYAALQAGALAWARSSTTVVRARQFLAACGLQAP